MLAWPVRRVHGPALTAAARPSRTTLSRSIRGVAIVRVPSLPHTSACIQTRRGSSFAPRTKAPDPSASAWEHKDGQNQHATVSVTFPGKRGRLRLLDRVPCVRGWRWCAACVRAPLSPPEGSSQPPELRPGRKLKVAPAMARVSRRVPSAHVQHSEIAMRATVPNAPRSAKQYSCTQKPNAKG